MEKTFRIVGVSTINNQIKFRFGNQSLETHKRILENSYNTNIILIKLEKPLTKSQAVAHFKKIYPQFSQVKHKKYFRFNGINVTTSALELLKAIEI